MYSNEIIYWLDYLNHDVLPLLLNLCAVYNVVQSRPTGGTLFT